MPPPIEATPSQIQEVERLLHLDGNVLSSRRRLRLQTIRTLIYGVIADNAQEQPSMGREGLRKLRNEIDSEGLENVLVRLSVALDRKVKGLNTSSRRRRGAPGASSLRGTVTTKSLRLEPIVSLASLILASDVQVAVLAVQSPQHKSGSERNARSADTKLPGRSVAFKSALKFAEQPMRAQWTRGGIDEWVRRPFLFIPEIEKQAAIEPPLNSSIQPLGLRFTAGWEYIALTKGRDDKVKALVDHLVEDRRHVVVSVKARIFVRHLESVLSSFLVGLNWRGILPTLDGLLEAGIAWRARQLHSFSWHSNERKALAGTRDRIVDFQIRAAGGYLLTLTSNAQRRVPNDELFPLFSSTTRARIEGQKGRLNEEHGVAYYPFPNFPLPAADTARELNRMRKLLASNSKTVGFDYAVRLRAGQMPWLRFSEKLLTSKKRKEGNAPKVGVVSLPRQFLFPEGFGLHARSTLSNEGTIGNTTHQGSPALVFHSPQLLQSVRDAFNENRYGDRLSQIEGFDKWWRHLSHGPTTPSVIPGSQRREFGRNDRLFETAFHFSDEELRGGPLDASARHRLNSSFIPEVIAVERGRLEMRSETCVFPGYRRDEVFLRMFKALDADFLLREISDRNWNLLRTEVEQWKAAVHAVIRSAFFLRQGPIERVDTKAALRTLHSHFRSEQTPFEADLTSWTNDALNRFESSGRILRRALENAQRLSLDGHEPRALVILTHQEILSNWKSFLGQRLRGHVTGISGNVEFSHQGDENMAGEGEGSANELEERDEAAELDRLLTALYGKSADTTLGQKFIDFATAMPSSAWAGALGRFKELGLPDQFGQRVRKALRLVRQEAATESQITEFFRSSVPR